MPDIVQTRSQLQYLFRDNLAQEITAQDMRDLLISIYLATDVDALVATATATSSFDFSSSPLSTWTINHNLGKFPATTIVDTSGNIIFTDVQYVNNNQIVVHFSIPFAGYVYLN